MKKSEIRNLVKHYQGLLGLDHWDIEIEFKKIDGYAIAQNKVLFKYRQSLITFDMEVLNNHTDATIKHAIVHELLHCYFGIHKEASQSLQKYFTQLEEEFTEEKKEDMLRYILYFQGFNNGLEDMTLSNEEYSVDQLTRILVKLLK